MGRSVRRIFSSLGADRFTRIKNVYVLKSKPAAATPTATTAAATTNSR